MKVLYRLLRNVQLNKSSPSIIMRTVEKIRKICEFIAGCSSCLMASAIILQVIKYIEITNMYIPLPIICVLCYTIVKIVPIGFESIRELLSKRDLENMTEEDLKQFEELKNFIDEKYFHVKTERTHNEPANQLPERMRN